MARAQGIANARQHISDWVSHNNFSLSRFSTGHRWPARATTARGRMSSVLIRAYQLDFVTPGIWPSSARLRKQIRHNSNLRRYPRDLPQLLQRVYALTANFGFFSDLTIQDVLAMSFPKIFFYHKEQKK